jgi:polyisoprenoid-binding protein YceI
MDNNTYKALKTNSHKHISFIMTSGTVSPVDANTYNVKVQGKLTLAGNTRETDLLGIAKFNPADKSITITGTKKMKMTEFGVKPPTVMMGTIKTGNDISITYHLKVTR